MCFSESFLLCNSVTDVRIAVLFSDCVWELSVSVTEGSQRTMEEGFEMSVLVTATLLICAWAGGSERLRQSKPKKLSLCLACLGRGVCSKCSDCERG